MPLKTLSIANIINMNSNFAATNGNMLLLVLSFVISLSVSWYFIYEGNLMIKEMVANKIVYNRINKIVLSNSGFSVGSFVSFTLILGIFDLTELVYVVLMFYLITGVSLWLLKISELKRYVVLDLWVVVLFVFSFSFLNGLDFIRFDYNSTEVLLSPISAKLFTLVLSVLIILFYIRFKATSWLKVFSVCVIMAYCIFVLWKFHHGFYYVIPAIYLGSYTALMLQSILSLNTSKLGYFMRAFIGFSVFKVLLLTSALVG